MPLPCENQNTNRQRGKSYDAEAEAGKSRNTGETCRHGGTRSTRFLPNEVDSIGSLYIRLPENVYIGRYFSTAPWNLGNLLSAYEWRVSFGVE